MSGPVKIIAILAPRGDTTAELEALLQRTAQASRAEPGNLQWEIWREQAEPGRFVLNELYVDNDAVIAHRESPHFKEYVAASLKPGKTAWVWLDSRPWRLFRARVESVGRGIARSDTPDQLLPYVAPTTNWIRLQRRLPVTIVFDPPVPPNELYMGADARVLIVR